MTLHESIKSYLSGLFPKGTTIAEVFLPFDARTSTYRAESAPVIIFRIEELEDKGFGLFRLTLRIDMMGKTADVEKTNKTICAAFAEQVNDGKWEISLASGLFKEIWETDLNVDWGTLTLKGVAIEQGA